MEVRKETDAYGKAMAVPPTGIVCGEKGASNGPGLLWPVLTWKNKAHAFNQEHCSWSTKLQR